jgi:hypothetical protein
VAFIVLVAVLVLAAGPLVTALAQVSPLDAMRQPPATGIVGFILAKQSLFYRELSGLLRAAALGPHRRLIHLRHLPRRRPGPR